MGVRSEIKAGKAWVELAAKENLSPGLNAGLRRMRTFGRVLSSVGTGLIGASAAIVAPLAGGLKIFADHGDALAKMSQRTGLTVESLGQLGHAATQSGASVQDMESGLRFLSKNMTLAVQGNKTAKESFAALGLSIDDLLAMNPEERFLATADALSRVRDPALKSGLAMQVFGRGGTALLPMLADGRKGIEALMTEARELNLVMSNADAQNAVKLSDAWSNLKKSGLRVAEIVGGALAPALLEMIAVVQKAATAVIGWVDNNRELVTTIAAVAAGIGAAGAVLLTLGVAITVTAFALSGLAAAFGLVTGLIAALFTPVGAVAAALIGLSAWIISTSDAGSDALAFLTESFAGLKETAVEAWGGIVAALRAGDFELAGRIAWLGLVAAWQEGRSVLMGIFDEIWAFFEKGWLAAVASAAAAFAWLWAKATGGDADGAVRVIADDLKRDWADVDRAMADASDARARDLAKARDDLRAAVADADKLRTWGPGHSDGENEPMVGGTRLPSVDSLSRMVRPGAGAFNAAAAANLGRTAGVEEKQLEQLQKLNESNDDIATAVRQGGLAFA